MFARSPAQASRQPHADPAHWAAREAEAQRNAAQVQRQDPHDLRATPLPAEAVATGNDVAGASGHPLTLKQREFFEAQFGRDFSQVRVHADAQAAQLADEASAKALTTGNHIVFGPGQYTPASAHGTALIAHELTHVAQQGDVNGGTGGVTQSEPKSEKKGIGATPPPEPVIVAPGVAAEDNFVLFNLDSAEVLASEKQLAEIFGIYAVPVTIELHGYASREGDTGYNSNLSGHRAVALKAKALKLLPPGSQVVMYAHGESEAFGAAKDNRRVGIKLVLGTTPAQDPAAQGGGKGTAKGRDALSFDPIDPTLTKPTIPGQGFSLSGLPTPSTTTVPILPNFTLPPLRTPSLLDWSEMRSPFTMRGLQLSDRDAKSIEQNWWTTYNFLRSLGLAPGLAAWGANKGTSYAYDKLLSHENPNVADMFDQDWEKTRTILNPGEKEFRTPIVPILTPTTLEWMSKTFFNKDWKFTF